MEDEAFVALDLAFCVEDAGGRVVGPAATLAEAISILDCEIGGAILDVHLPDGDVGPVLHALRARGVPVLVQSGGGLPARLKEAYPDLLVMTKPNDPAQLISNLCRIMNA